MTISNRANMKAFLIAFALTLGHGLADILVGLLRLATIIGLGITAAYYFGAFNP